MTKLEGTQLTVIRHSFSCLSTGYFFYSDNITALIEDTNKDEQSKNNR